MTCVSCGSPVVQAAPRRRGQPAICARCALTASEAIACCDRCHTWRSCRWLAGRWLCVTRRRSCFAAALRENGARRLLGAIKEGEHDD